MSPFTGPMARPPDGPSTTPSAVTRWANTALRLSAHVASARGRKPLRVDIAAEAAANVVPSNNGTARPVRADRRLIALIRIERAHPNPVHGPARVDTAGDHVLNERVNNRRGWA